MSSTKSFINVQSTSFDTTLAEVKNRGKLFKGISAFLVTLVSLEQLTGYQLNDNFSQEGSAEPSSVKQLKGGY